MKKLVINFEQVPVEVAVKVLQKENPAAKLQAIRKLVLIKSSVKPRKVRARLKNLERRAQ
jgi:hypothetical protein